MYPFYSSSLKCSNKYLLAIFLQGWERLFNDEYQREYFFHAASGETSWEEPEELEEVALHAIEVAAAERLAARQARKKDKATSSASGSDALRESQSGQVTSPEERAQSIRKLLASSPSLPGSSGDSSGNGDIMDCDAFLVALLHLCPNADSLQGAFDLIFANAHGAATTVQNLRNKAESAAGGNGVGNDGDEAEEDAVAEFEALNQLARGLVVLSALALVDGVLDHDKAAALLDLLDDASLGITTASNRSGQASEGVDADTAAELHGARQAVVAAAAQCVWRTAVAAPPGRSLDFASSLQRIANGPLMQDAPSTFGALRVCTQAQIAMAKAGLIYVRHSSTVTNARQSAPSTEGKGTTAGTTESSSSSSSSSPSAPSPPEVQQSAEEAAKAAEEGAVYLVSG